MSRALAVGGLVVCSATILVVTGASPALTVEADGLRLAYPAARSGGALAAALALAAAAALVTRRHLRWLLLAAAAGSALHAAASSAWLVTADGTSLRERRLTGSRVVAWADVVEAVNEPAGLRLTLRDGRSLAIDVLSLEPPQRAALERSIARRLEDARPR
jgi:hypothetical protein